MKFLMVSTVNVQRLSVAIYIYIYIHSKKTATVSGTTSLGTFQFNR